ncbi:unnamed protein product [Peronospora farinosa]|uniref:U1-type domain-containing protein n=1 Tax=Peronospora farinosa TaxID=134698 RepID=A0ABN8C3F5_9STRA|nr:unnamed protein product [Peronospora farinosa]
MTEKSNARKGGSGVANVARQTWDREHYEKLAELRANGQFETDTGEGTKKVIASSKEEFQTANEGAAGPAGSARAFLKARSAKVALENSVGTIKVVKSDELSKHGGYYCEVCECGLKDSVAYLDHINGKKHLRKLGFSMRVERSTVDQVKNRLQSASKRKYDFITTKKLDTMEDYEKKLKAIEEKEAQVKQAEKRAEESQEIGKTVPDDTEAEMMAMMGFGGFGGSKKS